MLYSEVPVTIGVEFRERAEKNLKNTKMIKFKDKNDGNCNISLITIVKLSFSTNNENTPMIMWWLRL